MPRMTVLSRVKSALLPAVIALTAGATLALAVSQNAVPLLRSETDDVRTRNAHCLPSLRATHRPAGRSSAQRDIDTHSRPVKQGHEPRDTPGTSRAQTSWMTMPVPGIWKESTTGTLRKQLADYDGFAWYRCAVTIPRSWKNKDLQLHVEPIDEAHAVYFNGVKIGSAGRFPGQNANPPEKVTPPKKNTDNTSRARQEAGTSIGHRLFYPLPHGRGSFGQIASRPKKNIDKKIRETTNQKTNEKTSDTAAAKYPIPAKIVQPGENNVVAIRVYDRDGSGGFHNAAPTLIAGKKAIAFNGNWEFRTGDDADWAKGPTKLNNAGIFWRVMDVDIALRNAQGAKILKPAEALETFTVPDDLQLDQVLTEPTVRQPVFINFDERGRMWVVQYLQYPYPAGLKMVSKDRYWRAVYDKTPPPPPKHFPGADRITIHEDTNGDGTFDKHKTFVDGLSIVTSCVRGRGGVWVLNPPYLLFYPDKNNDDTPDGPPEVHLKGFGLEDTHSVVNSLRWGPDGWLYAAQGSTVSGNVSRPGEKNAVHSMGQLIWRYHPETRKYEIFAEGGGNAFGVELDAKGRLYSGHNGGNTRGFHYVQGGYYRKGFSKHGPLSNPYAFGYFPAMKHPKVPRFTHNFVIYEADALPQRYLGNLFGVEPLQGQVVQADMSADGSTYKTKDINRVIKSSDRRFRPVDIKVGPNGGIYVADFYEPQISHREHFSGQVDKSTGRIYRLRARNGQPHNVPNLAEKSTRELIELLKHPNKWHRQTALRLIGDRKDASVVPLLKRRVLKADGQFALECLWALNQSGGFNESVATKTLHHEDPHVRLWTVRLLCDDFEVSGRIARQLATLAEDESYVQVRSQLACSARRLPAERGLPVVRALLSHSEDVSDPHVPLLLWWAIEAKAGESPEAVLKLFKEEQLWSLPMVKQHILERLMRRFAQSGSRSDLHACAKLFNLSPGKEYNAILMKGFEAAFKGRSLAGLPVELTKALSQAGGGSLTFRIRQGDQQAVDKAFAAIHNKTTPAVKRIEYAQVFGEVQQPKCIPVLLQTLSKTTNDKLKMAILTALQAYKADDIAKTVIRLYPGFSPDVRAVAQTLLVSRGNWNRRFLKAVDAERIDKSTIPLDVVRKMTLHDDRPIAALIKKHWKDIQGATNAEMQKRIAGYRDVLAEGSGDPYVGKRLFNKSCAKCHILFGAGGRIGPDLTSYKRDDTLRMLINVVNPGAEIREGFETYIVLTDDGRTATGFLYDQDNRVVVIRGADGQNITIPRENIEILRPQKKSLMPEGLLKDLTAQQVRDLFAYLRSSQPLNN